MKTILAFAALALTLSASSALASWKFPAQVRSEDGDGFTPWTRATVLFATGNELNRVTPGLKYEGVDGRYAVIPMTSGEYNVVRLSGYVNCGSTFTPACLPGGRADGFDGQGHHWQVCTNPKCD
jgi:hypothetical protein